MSRKLTTEEFIQKARTIHGDKYNYSLVNYISAFKKIKIICPVHGIFIQTPCSHSYRFGCPKCRDDKLAINRKKSLEQFIIDANKIHEYIYDYSLVQYINAHVKIKILCPKHGLFEQTPNNHLNKKSCPKCKKSKGEMIIEKWLKENNINFINQKRFNDCRGDKYPLSFDFYLQHYNICIEYDGEQHNRPIKIWGGLKSFNRIKIRDKIKNEYCLRNNIDLIRIPYSKNFESILSTLTSKLSFILKSDYISL